jgi:hypothetical protein
LAYFLTFKVEGQIKVKIKIEIAMPFKGHEGVESGDGLDGLVGGDGLEKSQSHICV